MVTTMTRESNRQPSAAGKAPASPRKAAAAERGVNQAWAGLALGARPPAIQRKCAACSGGSEPCPACKEKEAGLPSSTGQ